MSTPVSARRCRAKNPAACRVHGPAQAARIRAVLTDATSPALTALQTAVEQDTAAYAASKEFATRLMHFEKRLELAVNDLQSLRARVPVTGQSLNLETVRGEITHNLSPVIGWLHGDLAEQMGRDAYINSDARARVDDLYAAVVAAKTEIATLVLPPVTVPAAKR